jgi:uncharacterized protein YggE
MIRNLARAAALALPAFLSGPALAQEIQPPTLPPTLNVTGTGEVSVAPDMATLRIGVETRGDSAAAAVAANNEAAQAVIAAIKGNGVADKDIQTSNFSVSPVYDETSYQRPGGPRIIGYQATNQVAARVRDLDRLPGLLDATVGSGANRIDGLEFGLADDTAAADEARRLAVEDARRKAEVYAEAAGVRLGPVRSIGEGGGGPIPYYDRAMRAEAAAAVPIERGQTTVAASVHIVWEIAPAP